MLNFFRSNQLFNSILLIFYIALLRFSVIKAPFKWTPSGEGVFSQILYSWVGSQEVISHLLAVFLLLMQGFMVNALTNNNRLSNEANLFPGLFYVLISCCLPDFLYLSPVLVGNTFFLIALLELFDTYKNPACSDKIFNAGLWTGVASMFYLPFIFYFMVLMAGLNILRAFDIRERLTCLFGLLLPFFFTGLYYFMNNKLGLYMENQFGKNLGFLSIAWQTGFTAWLKATIFGSLILYVLANNSTYLTKKTIQEQKKISILYWLLLVTAISAVFQNNLTFEHFLMMAPTLGIFLGFSFGKMKPQWAESIHFLLLVGALAMQFLPWWV